MALSAEQRETLAYLDACAAWVEAAATALDAAVWDADWLEDRAPGGAFVDAASGLVGRAHDLITQWRELRRAWGV